MIQIHIAGAVRTGRSTLASGLAEKLKELGERPIVVDVDETRRLIFREDEPLLGSEMQKTMQKWTYNSILEFHIKDILRAGGIPIFAATHAHPETYERARAIPQEMGSCLRFIILEEPSFHEMVRRYKVDTKSFSDMHD